MTAWRDGLDHGSIDDKRDENRGPVRDAQWHQRCRGDGGLGVAPDAQPAMIVANASSTTVSQCPREAMMQQPVAGPLLGQESEWTDFVHKPFAEQPRLRRHGSTRGNGGLRRGKSQLIIAA